MFYFVSVFFISLLQVSECLCDFVSMLNLSKFTKFCFPKQVSSNRDANQQLEHITNYERIEKYVQIMFKKFQLISSII